MTMYIAASTSGTVDAPVGAVWELLGEWKQRESVPAGARWSEWTEGSKATIELMGVRAIPVRSCDFTISTFAQDAATQLVLHSSAQPTMLGQIGRMPLQRFSDYLVRNILRALIRDLENEVANRGDLGPNPSAA